MDINELLADFKRDIDFLYEVFGPKEKLNTGLVIEKINTVIDKINDDYGWSEFGNVKVIIMLENGFINATKLCTLGNKHFRNWYKTEQAKSLINFVEKANKMNAVITVDKGVDKQLSGTYVHPDIIIHVGSWISNDFAVMVSRIVMNYFAEQSNEKLKKEIAVKDDKIDELKTEIMDLKKMHEESLSLIKEQKNTLRESFMYIKDTHSTVKNISQNKIKSIISANDEFVIILKNYSMLELSPEMRNCRFPYSVLKRQRKSYIQSIRKHKEIYPMAEILYEFKNPNAVMLWSNMKIQIPNFQVKYSGVYFINGYTEEEFIIDLISIDDQKYDELKKMQLNVVFKEF